MNEETLEQKCRKAVIDIASNVKEINTKITELNVKIDHHLTNYREDYYKLLDDRNYHREMNGYSNGG